MSKKKTKLVEANSTEILTVPEPKLIDPEPIENNLVDDTATHHKDSQTSGISMGIQSVL